MVGDGDQKLNKIGEIKSCINWRLRDWRLEIERLEIEDRKFIEWKPVNWIHTYIHTETQESSLG
jgi:hypothetical protein